jgi:CheY-like chemotaxis protein
MRDRPLGLIVEFDRELATGTGIRLQQAGFNIDFANTAQTGLQTAENRIPDVILVDVLSTFLDGFCFLRQLRQSKLTRMIPALAFARFGITHEAQQLGIVGVVTKPYRLEDLVSTTTRAVHASWQWNNSGNRFVRSDPAHSFDGGFKCPVDNSRIGSYSSSGLDQRT